MHHIFTACSPRFHPIVTAFSLAFSLAFQSSFQRLVIGLSPPFTMVLRLSGSSGRGCSTACASWSTRSSTRKTARCPDAPFHFFVFYCPVTAFQPLAFSLSHYHCPFTALLPLPFHRPITCPDVTSHHPGPFTALPVAFSSSLIISLPFIVRSLSLSSFDRCPSPASRRHPDGGGGTKETIDPCPTNCDLISSVPRFHCPFFFHCPFTAFSLSNHCLSLSYHCPLTASNRH